VSGGGVRINMIPREGGNRFSGSAFIGGSDGGWQSNNVTPELRARGLRGGNRITHIYDINFGLGGPIRKPTHSTRMAGRPNRSRGFRTRWSG
jgi:hypothetical protein